MDPISEEEHRQIDALVGVPSKTLALGGAYEGAARFDALPDDWQAALDHALAAETGSVIVEIQDGAKRVVDAVGQFSSQLNQ